MKENKTNNLDEIVNQEKGINFGKRILLGTSTAATYFSLTYLVQSPFSEGEITPTTLYLTGGFFLLGLFYSNEK